jgi:hypothetical protein
MAQPPSLIWVHPFINIFCLSASPQWRGQMTMDWNLWNGEPKYFFPLSTYFSQVFYHSEDRKLLEKRGYYNYSWPCGLEIFGTGLWDKFGKIWRYRLEKS